MKRRRIAALLLTLALITGCSGSPPEPIPKEDSRPVMGRYVEKEILFPGKIENIYKLHVNTDGTLEFLGGIYSGADLYTLDAQSGEWSINKLSGQFPAYCYDSKDQIYFSSASPEQNWKKMQINRVKEPFGAAPVLYAGQYERESLTIEHFAVCDNGDFLVCEIGEPDQEIPILRFGPDGTLKQTLRTGRNTVQSLAVSGNTLAVLSGSQILEYDLDYGQLTAQTALPEGNREPGIGTLNVLLEVEKRIRDTIVYHGDSLYFCDATGIYRKSPGGEILEHLVDGNLTAFGLPSMVCEALCVKDDTFIALFSNEAGEYTLYQYYFDPEVPSRPDKQLTIRSLKENKTIRQAAGVFHRQNPDTYVTYEPIVQSTDAAAPVRDATALLMKELQSGICPDILVLDGLPLETVFETGILMELSIELEALLNREDFLDNILNTFQRPNGTVYAVPARFSVPYRMVSDFREISHKNEEYKKLLQEQLPIFYTEWIYNGSLNMEAVQQTLKAVQEPSQPFTGILAHPLDLYGKVLYYEADYETENGYNYSYRPELSPKGVFIPQSIVGICKTAQDKTKAFAFLETVFSGQIQGLTFGYGFPVSKKMLKDNTRDPDLYFRLGYNRDLFSLGQELTQDLTFGLSGVTFSVGHNTGEVFRIYRWPMWDYWDMLFAEFQELSVPCILDASTQELLMEEAEGFFAGTESAEQAAERMAKVLNEYL